MLDRCRRSVQCPGVCLDKKDVAEVIRVDSNPYACGITNAKMTYKTPDGQTKVYDYKAWGNGCAGD